MTRVPRERGLRQFRLSRYDTGIGNGRADLRPAFLMPRWRNTIRSHWASNPADGKRTTSRTTLYSVDTPVADGTTERRVEGFSELDLTGSYAGFKASRV